MHNRKVEEHPRRQLEVGHRISEIEILHIRPVLLCLRTRGLSVALCLREGNLVAEGSREDLRQIRLLARHDSPIVQRQAYVAEIRSPLWRLDVGGSKVEEVGPLPRILRARNLSGRRVDEREPPVSA